MELTGSLTGKTGWEAGHQLSPLWVSGDWSHSRTGMSFLEPVTND